MLGHAVADALGVPVEFMSREQLDRDPVVSMRGFGTHKVPAGSWSDDTSMALATLDSLSCGRIDYDDIMKKFSVWANKAEYTPMGWRFDAGGTCLDAIWNYQRGIPALKCGLDGDYSNGNGSLMRIHPPVLYCIARGFSDAESVEIIENYSRLTHAHERSLVGCVIYYFILKELIKNPEKASLMRGIEASFEFVRESPEMIYYMRLFSGEIVSAREEEIKSSGYIVDTLEAAIWVTLNTKSYREATLRAVNLGEDTDTVAAIAGTLVAALYGISDIPEDWLSSLIRRDYIEKLCDKAYDKWFDG